MSGQQFRHMTVFMQDRFTTGRCLRADNVLQNGSLLSVLSGSVKAVQTASFVLLLKGIATHYARL
jgi:hypothetical protein